MSDIRAWYGYIKDQPCAACGQWGSTSDPIEVAHIRCLISEKTNQPLPRSHKGFAAYSCLPLHRSEHLQLHERGEKPWLDQHIGLERAFSLVATLIARYYISQEDDS